MGQTPELLPPMGETPAAFCAPDVGLADVQLLQTPGRSEPINATFVSATPLFK